MAMVSWTDISFDAEKLYEEAMNDWDDSHKGEIDEIGKI